MLKLSYNIRQILVLVLTGLFVIIAVAAGYVLAVNLFYLFFALLSYVVGGLIAGIAFMFCNILLFWAALYAIFSLVFVPENLRQVLFGICNAGNWCVEKTKSAWDFIKYNCWTRPSNWISYMYLKVKVTKAFAS